MRDKQSLHREGIKWPQSKLPIYDLLIRYCLNVIEGIAAREIARQFEVQPSTITRQVQKITDLRDSSPFIDGELEKVEVAGDDQMNKLSRVLEEYLLLRGKGAVEDTDGERRSFIAKKKKSVASLIFSQPSKAKRMLLNEADVIKLQQIAAEIGCREPNDEVLQPIKNKLGPELSFVLINTCCTDMGIGEMEKELKIPARSGKVLLQVAIRQMQVF